MRTSSSYSPDERKVEAIEYQETPEEEAQKVITVGDPSDVELEALKRTYDGLPLFKTVVSKNTFIYTVLTKNMDDEIIETQQRAAQRMTPQQIEQLYRERVIQKCVLWPREFSISMLNRMSAGVEYALYAKIMNASGMNDPIYGDDVLIDIETMEPPNEETINKIKADERHIRLGLVYRKINAVSINAIGDADTKAVGHFIYTALERLTYNNLMAQQANSVDPVDLDAKILQYGVVFPRDFDWDSRPAGWARIIAQGILELSGFVPTTAGTIEDEQLV
jgi:hypothetical protein